MDKFPDSSHWGLWRRALAVLVARSLAQLAYANPASPPAVSGSASFSTQGGLLSVTKSSGAILNWQRFSINRSEFTKFIEKLPVSTVSNRVVGLDPSCLLNSQLIRLSLREDRPL